jgi:hypothetical protein
MKVMLVPLSAGQRGHVGHACAVTILLSHLSSARGKQAVDLEHRFPEFLDTHSFRINR